MTDKAQVSETLRKLLEDCLHAVEQKDERGDLDGLWYRLRAALSAPPQQEAVAKPFAWVRLLNGEIDWGEMCISGDPDHFELPDDAREEGYSVIPLYAHPQAEVVADVTDEMCKRAVNAWFVDEEPTPVSRDFINRMRKAIRAAFPPPTQSSRK